jgi:hypothetical protein
MMKREKSQGKIKTIQRSSTTKGNSEVKIPFRSDSIDSPYTPYAVDRSYRRGSNYSQAESSHSSD